MKFPNQFGKKRYLPDFEYIITNNGLDTKKKLK